MQILCIYFSAMLVNQQGCSKCQWKPEPSGFHGPLLVTFGQEKAQHLKTLKSLCTEVINYSFSVSAHWQ